MKITETAFYLLRANIHSSRLVIQNLVEEKSFLEDEQECKNAERNLLQSNKRIEQEVAWLPGVEPEIASRLVKYAENGHFSCRYTHLGVEKDIPILAACNLLSSTVLHILDFRPDTIDITQFDGIVRKASELYDLLDPDDELARINADRSIAGFPKFEDKQILAESIDNQLKELSSAINQTLGIFDEEEVKEWLSSIIEELTLGGTIQLPCLLEELVYVYELKKNVKHTQQEEEISRLILEIEKTLQEGGDEENKQRVALLRSLLEKWSDSVYPILLSYKSKGISHKTAENIISDVRNLYIKAVDDYNDEEIFSSLCESLAFAIETVPKFSAAVKDDLLFLHGRFRDSILLKKIQAICSSYEVLPNSKVDIVASFNQLKQQLSREFIDNIGEESGDWICLLFIKYGVALTNRYNDFENSLMVFKEALKLRTSDRIKMLLNDNIRRVERNKKFFQKKKIENEENRKQYIIKQEKQKKDNRKKNICTAVICAILTCCAALVLWHINSPEYEWMYISSKPLKNQLIYLKEHPSSKVKKQLSKLIVRQISSLPNEEMDKHYMSKVVIDEGVVLDEDAVFDELTSDPTIRSLSLFLKLFPDASSNHKQAVQELQTSIAERDWKSLGNTYTLDRLQNFLSTYEGIIDSQEIQRRVFSALILSDDADYIASFLSYIEDSTRKEKLMKRIGKIEQENWTKDALKLTSISALVTYREKLTTEGVKVLVDKKIAEMEEKAWRENYSKSTSEASLLNFKQSLRNEEVKKLVDKRLQELYASFAFAQKLDTIEAYNRFITLSSNQEEKEKARRRIIDLEVEEIAKGRHSVLPPQHDNAYQYTRTGFAEIEIKNDTAYPLTAMYSGNESEKVTIPAYGKKTVQLRSGEYAIAVKTTQPNVTPFYGKERIDSGKYQVTYYISSTPSYRGNYSWR